VANVSIRYADRTSSLTLTAYDQPGNVVGVAVGQQTTLTSTGQCGVIDAWGTLRINSPTGPIASVTMHDSGNFFAIDDFTFSAGFQIIRPSDNDTFPLTQSSFTQTLPITFEAEPIAPGAAVQWTAQLNYATSGGRGHFQEVRNFATDPTNTTQNETYTSTGGKVTVQATETSTTTQTAQPISVYVVGTAIPDTDITARLVSLYGGATPNLMTGIAKRESSYTQFVTRSLFGISALWPTESPDGGSHIGLMQMPVSKADAWDWQANTSDGVTLFSASKLPAATRLANRIIASHPGLRQLNSVELEHMALVLYGPAASANLSAQYYAPVPSASGWDWAVNTTGNPNGIAYANYIFSNVR